MGVDKDIQQFATAVGAKEPKPGTQAYENFRAIFRRPNYFLLKGKFLIIKISRTPRPFWGVGKDFLDLLEDFEYYLVLLTSSKEGWVFSKAEVKASISSDRWRLREKDQNYKINPPLPDNNSFTSPQQFLNKLGLKDT